MSLVGEAEYIVVNVTTPSDLKRQVSIKSTATYSDLKSCISFEIGFQTEDFEVVGTNGDKFSLDSTLPTDCDVAMRSTDPFAKYLVGPAYNEEMLTRSQELEDLLFEAAQLAKGPIFPERPAEIERILKSSFKIAQEAMRDAQEALSKLRECDGPSTCVSRL